MKNEAGVDWFAFQEALGKLGYMGIIDIEGPSGGTKVDAADTMFIQNAEGGKTVYRYGLWGLVVLGIYGAYSLFKDPSMLNAETVTEDGFGAEFECRHFWK